MKKTAKIFLLLAVALFGELSLAKSPAQACIETLSFYEHVHEKMYEACESVDNDYATQTIRLFAKVYDGFFALDVLQALTKIHSEQQSYCAMAMALQLPDTVSGENLQSACLPAE